MLKILSWINPSSARNQSLEAVPPRLSNGPSSNQTLSPNPHGPFAVVASNATASQRPSTSPMRGNGAIPPQQHPSSTAPAATTALPDADDHSGAVVPGGSGHIESFQIKTNTTSTNLAAAAGVDTTVAPEKVLERFFNAMKKDGRLTHNGWVGARKALIFAVEEHGEVDDVALNGVAERWSLHPDDVAALRKEAAGSFVSRNLNKAVKGDGNSNIVDTSGLTDPLFITEVEQTRNEWAR